MEQRFFICKHCGNIIAMVRDSGVPVVCCGEKMKLLEPGVVDAAVEKHLPVVAVNGRTVTVSVGSVAHPMTEEHLIQWIVLETSQGWQQKALSAGGAPEVKFALAEGEAPVAAWAYCNLHGLWKTVI